MAELLLVLLVTAAAGLAIAWPVLDRRAVAAAASSGDDRETLAARHRLALEAMRDVEADRRAGSLDAAAYAAQREEAEQHAARTLAALEAIAPAHDAPPPPAGGRRMAALLAAGLVGLMLLGFALPAPLGVAERTITDRALADAQAREDARQARIQALLDRLAAEPRDTVTLSKLADAYLAGDTLDDLQRGAVALLALIGLEPEDASAYRRLITAYISAGDWADARSALDSYAGIVGSDDPDLAFFRGLVALRADDDPAEAVRQFDRFLELSPHDARAGMVLSLREQAAAQLDGGQGSDGPGE